VRAPHARTTASALRVEGEGESRFGDPYFPGPRDLRMGDTAADGFAATGAHASNPVFGRLARLVPRFEEHLPLDTETKVILV
jgi:hypothetical protein